MQMEGFKVSRFQGFTERTGSVRGMLATAAACLIGYDHPIVSNNPVIRQTSMSH
jgi:hypothetical protein